MAEFLLGVVTEAVIMKLSSLGTEGISGLFSVNEDLQRLTEQFEMIDALLIDAEKKSTTSKATEIWLKRLENASIDADNLLGEIVYYQVVKKKILEERKDKVCIFFSSSNSLVFHLKMISKIKRVIFQINDIYKTAKQIGLIPIEIRNFPSDPRKVQLTDPFVDDYKIIGRDDDLRKVINHLLTSCSKDGNKNLFVMGIVGMPGQGKTTLAQLLIKENEIKNHFEKIIWTCVSNDFDVDRVLKDMLQSLTGEASQLTNREAIVKGLSKELEGKRFLLVLDDVWNENFQLWECMNNSLKSLGGSKGSKIVVTTRSELVVKIMDGFHYRLGVLSEKHSQELFEKIAFGSGRVRKTPELVKNGERIVGRCGGVPLALKAIGSLMSSQRDELEWRKIAESNIWNLLDGVSSAIKLSFDHLPSLSIKQCFTYCSIFPKDLVIDKKDLIQQWMAHGLLNPSREGDLEMEVVGNNYFKILLQRSFFQEDKVDDLLGNIFSCKMHDLVHDFASELSTGRSLIAKERVVLNSDNIKNIVHLSIDLGHGYATTSLNISRRGFSRLRTLHIFGHNNSSSHFLDHYECENLSVLSIVDWEMKKLPISISKMKHLRYLDIRKTRIDGSLPKFVSKLYNLQTLHSDFIKTLPKNFVRLFNLRYLDISTSSGICHYDHFVPWIGKLDHLRTLNCFHVSRESGCRIEELGNLNHLEGSLQVLGIENVETHDDAKKANLSKKCYIDSLALVWGNNNNNTNQTSVLEGLQPHPCLKVLNICHFLGKSLPSWISTMENLVKLTLRSLKKCEKIAPLGHLPFLKFLEIHSMESLKCICNDFYGWPNLVTSSTNSNHQSTSFSSTIVVFPSLVELNVSWMKYLEEWSDMVITSFLSSSNIVPFPSLKHVRMSFCSSLTYLPQGLFSASTSLESLTIELCPQLVSCPNVINFHSLKKLIIYPCPNLKVLPLGMDTCTSLCDLLIFGPASIVQSLVLLYLTNLRRLCLSLSSNIIDPYNNDSTSSSSKFEPYHYNYSSNVEDLVLDGEPHFKSLPEQIQHFTSLRRLKLRNFDGLETIPEWFGEFHSLESLTLDWCKSLANLPSKEVMCSGLTNLNELSISGCQILSESCKEETGAKWHKIAHIPRRFIRNYLA